MEVRLGRYRLRTPAVCGSVMGRDVGEIRTGISAALRQGADLVELRLDELGGKVAWDGLIREGLPTIVTNRPKREGGRFRGGEKERVRVLLEGLAHGPSCVDIELSTPGELREQVVQTARGSGVTVLISFHDIKGTPPVKDLLRVLGDLEKAGCDIAKIVTAAESPGDEYRVLDFLVQLQGRKTVPVITFAMGNAGRITRFVAPILGSPIVYAAARREAAPGQLDVATMKRWTRELTQMGVRG